MNIKLNGKEIIIKTGATIESLVRDRKIKPDTVVFELNRKIIEPEKWSQARIMENDEIEILTFMGGGACER